MRLKLAGNVRLGENEGLARNEDDSLVGATTRSGRQVFRGRFSDVNSDDGKITGGEFKNVRATATTDRLCTIGVRIGAEPAKKHGLRIHVTRQSGKADKKARIKYSAYTVVRICGFRFCYRVIKIQKHRKILGENIRTHRRNMKWSQEKLAEKSDLHHNYIGDIERGEENVSVDALKRIASALKVNLSDLVRGA